jgi:hypothetical protein
MQSQAEEEGESLLSGARKRAAEASSRDFEHLERPRGDEGDTETAPAP